MNILNLKMCFELTKDFFFLLLAAAFVDLDVFPPRALCELHVTETV